MIRSVLLAMSLMLVFVSGFISTDAIAYSRGPYLPQDADLKLPGTLVVRDGLNERCEDRRFPCDGHSELVLVQTGATYEFGNVGYDCIEIDDGAYGALKCTQTGFTSLEKFATCTFSTSGPAASNFEFRGFHCSK